MVTTGLTLDLRHVNHYDVQGWGTKRAALAALAALRETGRNVDGEIEAHRAETHLFRFWVLGRPDHFNGYTYLMTTDGGWVRGRLTDAYTGATLWTRLAGEVEPAIITHATRTVPHTGARRERYKTKSNGSCGRWVTSDDSVAICTCGWEQYASTREEARARAPHHRERN